ncbi:MAG: DUF2807 domain-containing protein [Parvularculaceae bacterium]
MIRLQDFTGAIDIAVGGAVINADLTTGAESYPVNISVIDGVLVIAGPKRPYGYNVHKEIDWRNNHEMAFAEFLESYPVLKVTAPAGTDLTFDDAIVAAVAGDLNSNVKIGGGYVQAAFGDLKGAEIGINGSGDVTVGDVAETLKVAIGGSGDFIGGAARRGEFTIGGSGDVRVGAISEDAVMSIGGSGDIKAAAIGGALSASIHGSGDVNVGAVGKGARLSIAGSGDLGLAGVYGPVRIDIAGNGDVAIAEGRAENLAISVAGSGDVLFGGVSTNLNVSVVGSGTISVASNEGALTISGRGGEVYVGGIRVSKPED